MANWLHQLQSLLGQQGASPSGESSKGSGLLPGAIGGLAGLLGGQQIVTQIVGEIWH